MHYNKEITKVTTPELGDQLPIFDNSYNKDYVATIENEDHGDYSIDWLIIKDLDGNETRRYNCRYLLSIVWG